MKTLIGALIVLILLVVALTVFFPSPEISDNTVKRFSSYEELKNFVKTNMETASMYYGYGVLTDGFAPMMAKTAAVGEAVPAVAGGSEDYSTTNIQVAGVDEADIVKNDGKYIYVVSGKKIVIIDAYPAENAKILSEIELNGTPQEIFINGNKLVVFGSEYGYVESEVRGIAVPEYGGYSTRTFINVYDVSNKENPVIRRNFSIEGNYFDSRMIGDYVYVVTNQPIYYIEDEIEIPRIYSGGVSKPIFNFPELYYFDVPDYSYTFTTILSVNTQNDNEDLSSKVFLTSATQNMFVSLNNIYVTYTKRVSGSYLMNKMIDDVFIPIVPADIANKIIEIRNSNQNSYEKWKNIMEIVQNYSESLTGDERDNFTKSMQDRMNNFYEDLAKKTEMTVVHKISIKDGKIEYKSNGEVPGNVLNQFSMDEYKEFFRIATTTGHVSRTGEPTSKNHVYVLDGNLVIIGKLEDLAPGERIYSARFLGDRVYLVTFKKIDPLFVIDLTDPYNPKVLGKLKIPGYSDYLHPYDENHIIGIGKETVEGEGGTFAWYQGIKISLFDVTDVSSPKEISKYNIGDRGTDSEALSDHKAFLFSKSKNLLVIPILLAEIDEEKYPGGVSPSTYGDYVWQGAYVLDLSLENGFVLKGRVTHLEGGEIEKSGYYFYSPSSVKRSLYIGNVLYTLSNKMIKMNDLGNLNEVNKIELPYEQEEYPYWR